MNKEFLKSKKFWIWFGTISFIFIVVSIIADLNKPKKCDCALAYENFILKGKKISEWSDCIHSYQKDINTYLTNANLKLVPDNSGSLAGSWETGAYEYFQRNCENKIDTINTANDKGKSDIEKCFSSDGLKYSTQIKIIFLADNSIKGSIESVEIGTTTIDKGSFTGTINGNKLTIKFTGHKPVVGDGSEWTNDPWIVEKVDGVEVLKINFFAKNYDTNKWENILYEFNPCK